MYLPISYVVVGCLDLKQEIFHHDFLCALMKEFRRQFSTTTFFIATTKTTTTVADHN